MRRSRGFRMRGSRRRASVLPVVAVSTSVLLGFAALTVDVGHMYNARAQLQRTADASALAAAAALWDWSTGDPRTVAAAAAQAFAGYNPVLGEGVILESSVSNGGQYSGDVVFGFASMSESGTWSIDWTESDPLKINAVRVNVRRTADSPSGAIPLYFASIFGITETDIAAQATAVMTPRDIVFVLDLSASHNDDSSLRSFKNPNLDEIGNKPVYDYLYDDDALVGQVDGLGFGSQVQILDNGNGTSTITVNMTSDSSGATSALSKVVFGLPTGVSPVSYGTTQGYGTPTVGVNSNTGVYGLTFSSTGAGLGAGGVEETKSFSVTLNNSALNGMMMTVGTVAGSSSDASVEYNMSGKVTLGNMMNWGTEVTNASWNFANDPGLVKLSKNATWNLSATALSKALVSNGYDPYTTAEASKNQCPLGL